MRHNGFGVKILRHILAEAVVILDNPIIIIMHFNSRKYVSQQIWFIKTKDNCIDKITFLFLASSLSGSNINNNLPAGTIRIVNSNGEARLIPGAANFLSNALSNLGGGGGSAGGDGGGGGGSGLRKFEF